MPEPRSLLNLSGIASLAHSGVLFEKCLTRPRSIESSSRCFFPVLSKMKTRSAISSAIVRLVRLLLKRLVTSLAGTSCPPLDTRSSIRAWHRAGLVTQMNIRLILNPAVFARFIRSSSRCPEKVVSTAKLIPDDNNRSCSRTAALPACIGLIPCVAARLSGEITGIREASQRSAIVVFPAPFGPATIHNCGI